VLAGIVAFAAISALLIVPASFASIELLYASIALYGGLAFAVYPVAVAHLIDHLDNDDILAGGSALLLVHGIGAAIGPALSGQLMAMTGASALPVYFAAVQGTLFLVAVWKMHQRTKDETTGDPAQFVPMVRTTPTALEMHPDESEHFDEQESTPSQAASG
jgi:predicted MFS family arabinose efflux permease